MKRQGSRPIPMMDRDTADDLPAHQVEYAWRLMIDDLFKVVGTGCGTQSCEPEAHVYKQHDYMS